MTFVDLDQGEVQQLADERTRAEAAAQRAAVEAGPVEAPSTTATAAPPAPEVTPEAHAASVDMLCGLLVVAGGAMVPEATRTMAAQLTFPAAVKYGGEIPYMVEICGIAGLAMIVRASFWPPKAPETQERTAA